LCVCDVQEASPSLDVVVPDLRSTDADVSPPASEVGLPVLHIAHQLLTTLWCWNVCMVRGVYV